MALDAPAFDQLVADALDALPREIARVLDNVHVVVEEEAPGHPERLGWYQGVPLTRRSGRYHGAVPDRIVLYRRTFARVYGDDPERLRPQVDRIVRHELAHHFGISDDRLREMGRY